MEPASRQYRQYFSHCRVYVRRYHSCRKCLYRLWIHRHEKVHRRTCCGCKRAQFHLDPFSKSLFLFCGKRRDRMKVLLWEGDGFVLLYKRLENGNFKWPRKESEVKPISWQEFRWLMEGLELEQKHAIKPAKPGEFC